MKVEIKRLKEELIPMCKTKVGDVFEITEGPYTSHIAVNAGLGYYSLNDAESTFFSGQKPRWKVRILPAGTELKLIV